MTGNLNPIGEPPHALVSSVMLPEHQARGERDDHHVNVVALAEAIRAPVLAGW